MMAAVPVAPLPASEIEPIVAQMPNMIESGTSVTARTARPRSACKVLRGFTGKPRHTLIPAMPETAASAAAANTTFQP